MSRRESKQNFEELEIKSTEDFLNVFFTLNKAKQLYLENKIGRDPLDQLKGQLVTYLKKIRSSCNVPSAFPELDGLKFFIHSIDLLRNLPEWKHIRCAARWSFQYIEFASQSKTLSDLAGLTDEDLNARNLKQTFLLQKKSELSPEAETLLNYFLLIPFYKLELDPLDAKIVQLKEKIDLLKKRQKKAMDIWSNTPTFQENYRILISHIDSSEAEYLEKTKTRTEIFYGRLMSPMTCLTFKPLRPPPRPSHHKSTDSSSTSSSASGISSELSSLSISPTQPSSETTLSTSISSENLSPAVTPTPLPKSSLSDRIAKFEEKLTQSLTPKPNSPSVTTTPERNPATPMSSSTVTITSQRRATIQVASPTLLKERMKNLNTAHLVRVGQTQPASATAQSTRSSSSSSSSSSFSFSSSSSSSSSFRPGSSSSQSLSAQQLPLIGAFGKREELTPLRRATISAPNPKLPSKTNFET